MLSFDRIQLLTFLLVANGLGHVANSQILVESPTTSWTAIQYDNIHPDFINDEQASSRDRDIVGDANNPAFYKAFWNGGTASILTDGQLAFRFRTAGDKNPSGYDGAAFVGIDLDGNGSIDVFVGVDRSGSTSIVGIWGAGSGANTSPNTTTLVSTPLWSEITTSSNYSFVPVTTTNDPGVTNTNLDGGSGGSGNHTDHFLSYRIDFSRLTTIAASLGYIVFDENSSMGFVAATATQANSLNSDLNGVNGNTGSSATWQSLGAISQQYSSSSISPVPEPRVFVVLLWGGALLTVVRRRLRD